ncbi:MatE efflux family protein [Oscillibacter valericigenes Sjm18-20]|nr:MatE efflux family protein [Oscillibacter valericigenes Sjm18-20]
MDITQEKISKLYRKYLLPCIFGGLVTSIYTVIDMVCVGQYAGPNGTAALAILSPLWTFFCCVGILFGIGGSVLMSNARGKNEMESANSWFTSSLIGICAVIVVLWGIIFFFHRQLLTFFGADEILLPLAEQYVSYLKYVVPLFPLGMFLGAFLRNDNAPNRAGSAVVAGGIFNIFGDVFFTFTLNMGISGAALATCLGQIISVVIMLTHFTSQNNTLRIVKPINLPRKIMKVTAIGFSAFITDLCFGVLAVLFNTQIMRYLGTAALAVYGVANSVALIVQTVAYGIGNASQPIISVNYGAKCFGRINETIRIGITITGIFGFVSAAFTILFLSQITKLFMDATPEVLEIANFGLRIYFCSFVLLYFNIFISYYFQSIMKSKISTILSIFRGLLVSSIIILCLPMITGGNAIWWTMPITEAIVGVMSAVLLKKVVAKVNTACQSPDNH